MANLTGQRLPSYLDGNTTMLTIVRLRQRLRLLAPTHAILEVIAEAYRDISTAPKSVYILSGEK